MSSDAVEKVVREALDALEWEDHSGQSLPALYYTRHAYEGVMEDLARAVAEDCAEIVEDAGVCSEHDNCEHAAQFIREKYGLKEEK